MLLIFTYMTAILTRVRIPSKIKSNAKKLIIDPTNTDWDNFDIPNFIVSKTGIHENEVKSITNGNLAKKLTKTHLEQLNAYEEVKGWFLKMKELYQ